MGSGTTGEDIMYHVMLLCKRGDMTLLSPPKWVDNWHVVRVCGFEDRTDATLYAISDVSLFSGFTWITDDPYDRNLPDHIQRHVNDLELFVL